LSRRGDLTVTHTCREPTISCPQQQVSEKSLVKCRNCNNGHNINNLGETRDEPSDNILGWKLSAAVDLLYLALTADGWRCAPASVIIEERGGHARAGPRVRGIQSPFWQRLSVLGP
jgi:hypothetical protein